MPTPLIPARSRSSSRPSSRSSPCVPASGGTSRPWSWRAGSAKIATAPVCSAAWRRCAGGASALTITAMPPAPQIAGIRAAISMPFSRDTSTRSPGATPKSAIRARRTSCARVRRAAKSTTRSPWINAISDRRLWAHVSNRVQHSHDIRADHSCPVAPMRRFISTDMVNWRMAAFRSGTGGSFGRP